MNFVPTENTKAVLLLTAPLIVGKSGSRAAILSPKEYRALAMQLKTLDAEPADLLKPDAGQLIENCGAAVDTARVSALLQRGFLLSQAVEHWQSRSISVISGADEAYPRRLKERLRHDAPILLYICGEIEILGRSALGVVGPRKAGEPLIEYARKTAALAARAGKGLVSGGAKGIDLAAMNGALEAGGTAVGVLPGNLEQIAMNREHRNLLLEGRLVLVSPFDPRAGFRVGHAMQRNKLIYALADATLVADADANKGGTWAGAIEQLRKYKGTVYVHSPESASEGIKALQNEGAIPWPNPEDADGIAEAINSPIRPDESPLQNSSPGFREAILEDAKPEQPASDAKLPDGDSGAEIIFYSFVAELKRLLANQELKPGEVASKLELRKEQANPWLKRATEEGHIAKHYRPVRYGNLPAPSQPSPIE